MSIADKIARLNTAKTNIGNAITAKGVPVASGDGYEDFAARIAAIPTGCEDVSTAAEMEAKKTLANYGKIYHYVGTTTADYINGRYYKLDKPEVTIEQVSPYYQWEESDIVVPGLDPSYQSRPFRSTNQGIPSSYSVCRLRIKGFTEFTLWINSYGRAGTNYCIASFPDPESIPTKSADWDAKQSTIYFSRDPTLGLNTSYWKKVVYRANDGLDEGEHLIYVVYRKTSSVQVQYTDTAHFVYEITGLRFTEYLAPEGTQSITANGTFDVREKASAVVNVPGIVPAGTLEIAANGTFDVTNYASAQVAVPGGVSGFKVYLKAINGGDNLRIRLNDDPDTDFDFNQYNDRWVHWSNLGGISSFMFYDSYYWITGSFQPNGYSSARFRAHGSSDAWTWINQNVTYTITNDIDLEIMTSTCLGKGTLITMADGSRKPIEEIEAGEFVRDYQGNPLKVYQSEKGLRRCSDDRDIWKFEGGFEVVTAFRHRFYNWEHQKMMYLNEWAIGEHAITEDGRKVALMEHIHEDVYCMYFSIWCGAEDAGNSYFAGGLLSGNRFTPKINID